MRHGKKFNHLTRKKGHRDSLLMNLAMSLIRYKRINTTLAKAKALRLYVEPLLTRAKENTTHNRRVVFSYLQDKYSINELFGPIAEKIADRPGGYVRILRTGYRWGDNAETAMIELVDFNELRNEATGEKAGRRRRRKKSVTSTGTAPVVAQPKVVALEPVVEDVVEDVVAPEVVEEVKEAEVVVESVADVVEEQPAAEEEKTSTDEEENKV